MNSGRNTIRLLGAMFLIVFIASILSDVLHNSATGSGSISQILVNISDNHTLLRISNLIALAIQSTGIVVLAVLLYIILNKQNRIIALAALGWWLAEAITLAVSRIGSIALIPLSLEFANAGAPEPSHYQTLGEFLYYGVDKAGYNIHGMFFCLGGILWYYLFFKSRYIPRVLSVWGLVTVCPILLYGLLTLYDRNLATVIPMMIIGAPYIVFEALIGPWLMIKGISDGSEKK
ncbi:DUF4386 domain-containing protein [candidate division KSB1 bacterium]|nr:DUF4386 domain-containing protein [candidate division KSB1 bacterium]